jgi:hypothetical protein
MAIRLIFDCCMKIMTILVDFFQRNPLGGFFFHVRLRRWRGPCAIWEWVSKRNPPRPTASSTPPFKMEGRCFFEDAMKQKLRVLGILPKERTIGTPLEPLADFCGRNAFG